MYRYGQPVSIRGGYIRKYTGVFIWPLKIFPSSPAVRGLQPSWPHTCAEYNLKVQAVCTAVRRKKRHRWPESSKRYQCKSRLCEGRRQPFGLGPLPQFYRENSGRSRTAMRFSIMNAHCYHKNTFCCGIERSLSTIFGVQGSLSNCLTLDT